MPGAHQCATRCFAGRGMQKRSRVETRHPTGGGREVSEGVRARRHQEGLTLRQGLSVCAPRRLNPFPGWKRPPTAKAMSVE